MSRTNISLGVMITTIVVVMALFFWPVSKTTMMESATVRAGALQKVCMLQGMAVQGEQQPIIAPIGGKVAQVYVKSGDYVQQGQLLIRIDSQQEETALSQLENQQRRLQNELFQWFDASSSDGSQLALLTELAQQRGALVTAIEYKQIRASEAGIIENLYLETGDYLADTGLIGSISTGGNKVLANWMAQQGQPPVPGMTAWWCKADGTKQEQLTLESVGMPAENNNQLIYPLVFRCADDESSFITSGETAPVCLLLQAVQVQAMVPVQAIDSRGQLWVLRDGYTVAVPAQCGLHNDDFLQVQNELAGETVLLNPDQLILHNGMFVRMTEDV